MAVRISTSKFLSSTVAQQAAIKGIDDPLFTGGGGPLPAGIKNGVAKLTQIYFENDEKYGEGFRAEAEILFPEVFNGQYIKGKVTKQWVTFDASNLEERIPRIRDILKGLAGRQALGDGKSGVDFVKIVDFLDKATKSKPIYFGFSTSPKESGEWPWENWYAAIPGFVPPSATTAPVTDQKKTEPSRNGAVVVESASHNPQFGMTGGPSSDNADQPVDVYSDDNDVKSVIDRANNGDESAMDKLEEWALALGYTKDDVTEASWNEIGVWVKTGTIKGGGIGEVLKEALIEHQKSSREFTMNQVYTYEPPGKRPGQRLKGRDCRVTNIDNVREVVTLTNLANKAEVYEVSFGDEYLK